MRLVLADLEDDLHQLRREEVGHSEECAGDDDETEDDSSRLSDVAAVGPLYTLELSPLSAQKVDEAEARVTGGV